MELKIPSFSSLRVFLVTNPLPSGTPPESLIRAKDTPVTQEITRVSGAQCQGRGQRSVYSLHSLTQFMQKDLLRPTPLPSPHSDSLFPGQHSSSESTVGRPGGTPTSLQGATGVELLAGQHEDVLCLFRRVDVCTEVATQQMLKSPEL